MAAAATALAAAPTAIATTAPKLFTSETLRTAAKQSEGIHLIPLSLRRAIKKYLRDRDLTHMNRKVLLLSQSFTRLKDANLQLTASASRALVEDPIRLPDHHRSGRWKIRSAYGDIGLRYQEDETVAYVASRMPAVYSAIHRVLKEVLRRLPDFTPARVLDFGAGPGSALWAIREVWPRSLQSVNLVEPSKSMQRAAQSLLQDLKGLPLIHSYDSLQALNRKLDKGERKHDIVICLYAPTGDSTVSTLSIPSHLARLPLLFNEILYPLSYALGEIPSLSERITVLRQLWDLTSDVLVLLEPGTPHGSNIICQMRSYILWMTKRKCRKSGDSTTRVSSNEKSISTDVRKNGAYVVAPCPHDGRCPLENTDKYCHFVQRLQRTTSQRAYKRSKGVPLRGFEDEKFSFVALRRGKRPSEAWPLDGMKFETLKERIAKRNPEDLIMNYSDQFETEPEDDEFEEDAIIPYASDATDIVPFHGEEDDEDEEEESRADLGSGWGRIIYMPIRRGKQIQMDVCRATNREGSEGTFERVVVTQSKNPDLHLQARRSLWGDLWPNQSSSS